MTTDKNIKTFTGVVSSDKMKDTTVVNVESYTKHPKYGKFVKKTKKFKVHDAGNTAKVGDKVEITETKPISKTKRFILVK
ncbi:30S ribosomal protein S17 [Candidatus Campbellbacteria bacterium]|nr:MAG: 30S ribosomal protein S17 [Candidatus Campbellbacteria bacterium]